jgi:segregation and condensation protein A
MSENEVRDEALASERNGSPDTRHPAPITGASGAYRVRLDLFEGPLDLLLHLIKRNELDVTNIPVAAVTEQYLSYLDLMRELRLDVAGEYLVMAATLLLIKSRMLLPTESSDDEEERDPRADLVRQLLEYQRYREAAASLQDRPRLGRDIFTRETNAEGVEPDPDALPALRVTTWQLMEAFRKVLVRAQPDPVHEVQTEPVSLRDRMKSMLYSLRVARSVTFDSLFDENSTRGFVIVTFLGLLELVKLGAVEAVQDDRWGPILIVLAVDDPDKVAIDYVEEYEGTVPVVSEEQTRDQETSNQ